MAESSVTVSVVDDDLSVRKALRRLVRSLALNVVTFSSAEEFLKYEDKEATACLILDVRMPGMSGLELQKRLAGNGHCIPIVFISGHHDDQVRREALAGGAVDFLYKPFDEAALLRAVDLAMSKKRGGRQVERDANKSAPAPAHGQGLR